MIDLKPLKDNATRFQEPLNSVIEMSKDKMSETEFISFFIGLRKKARDIDAKNKEVQK